MRPCAGRPARAKHAPPPPRRISHTATALCARPLDPRRGRAAPSRQGERLMLRRLATILPASSRCRCAAPAAAASWFELNFGLSGPRYDAHVPLCDDPGVLGQISSKFAQQGGRVLELQSGNPRHRARARGRLPALGRAGDPAPVLHRRRARLRRPQARRALFDPGDRRAGSASPGASNGAWSASTATGPTIRPAAWRGLDFRSGIFPQVRRALWMFIFVHNCS